MHNPQAKIALSGFTVHVALVQDTLFLPAFPLTKVNKGCIVTIIYKIKTASEFHQSSQWSSAEEHQSAKGC